MPEWKDVGELFRDPNFHSQSLDIKRSRASQLDSDFKSLDQNVQDELLGEAWNKYATPEQKQKVKQPPAPQTPDEVDIGTLFKDPSFHRQSLEIKRSRASKSDADFRSLDKNVQDELLGEAWNKYAEKKLPEPPSASSQFNIPTDKEISIPQKPSIPDEYTMGHQAWEGLKQGTQQSIEAGGGILQWAGQFAGVNKIKEWGKDIEDWANKSIQVDEAPEEMAGSIIDKPWLMSDPRWWARGAGSLIPYAAIFSALAVGATAAAPEILAAGGIAATPSAVMATAAGTNALINSLFIGASQYVDEKKAGKTDHQASVSAGWAATVDLPWTFITSRVGIFGNKEAGNVVKKIFRNMISEGVQEGGEQVIQNAFAKTYGGQRDIMAGVPESLILGGVMGPIVGKAIDIVTPGGNVPTNESFRTLELQTRAAIRGKRWGVMFQDATITPDAIPGLKKYVYEMSSTDPITGEETKAPATFFYNENVIKEEEIKKAVDTGDLSKLGYIDKKSPDTTQIVSIVDANGHEIASAAVKPENVDKQKKIFQDTFDANEPEHKDSKIITGPIDVVAPIIDSQRNDPSIDNVTETKEKLDRIVSGDEEAPAGVTVEPNRQSEEAWDDIKKTLSETSEILRSINREIEIPEEKTESDLPVGETTKPSEEVTKEDSTPKETPEALLSRLQDETAKLKADQSKLAEDTRRAEEKAKEDEEWKRVFQEENERKRLEREGEAEAREREAAYQARIDELKAEQARLLADKEAAAQKTIEPPPPIPTIVEPVSEITEPAPIPPVIEEANPELRAKLEALLAEKARLLAARDEMDTTEAPVEETTEGKERTPEVVENEIKAYDAMRAGMIVKVARAGAEAEKKAGTTKQPKQVGEFKVYKDNVAGETRRIIETQSGTKLIQGVDKNGKIYYEVEGKAEDMPTFINVDADGGFTFNEAAIRELFSKNKTLPLIAAPAEYVEYKRVEGGWKKRDKNGNWSGATMSTRTLIDKYHARIIDHRGNVKIGKSWMMANVPEEAKAGRKPKLAAPGRFKEVGGVAAEVVEDTVQPSVLSELEAESEENYQNKKDLEETRAILETEAKAKEEAEKAALPAPTVPTSIAGPTKTVTVLHKLTKEERAARKLQKKLAAPLTPEVAPEVTPEVAAVPAPVVEEVKPLTDTDYKSAITNIATAFENLTELDAEIARRQGEDKSGLTVDKSQRSGKYHGMPSSEFVALRARLLRAVDILGKTINQYESEHPEVGKSQITVAKELAPPPVTPTISQPEPVTPERLLTGDERKTVAYRLQVSNLISGTKDQFEPSVMDKQIDNASPMGDMSNGQQMSTGVFQVGDKAYRVDFTHDRNEPTKNKNIRYIREVDISRVPAPEMNQEVTEETLREMKEQVQKTAQVVVDAYNTAGTIEEKTSLLSNVKNDDVLDSVVESLEGGATTPEQQAAIGEELDQILGPVESPEHVLENIQSTTENTKVEPQYFMGLPSKNRPLQEIKGRRIQRVQDSKDGNLIGIRTIMIRLAKGMDFPLRFKIKTKDVQGKKKPLGLFRPKAETIQVDATRIAKTQHEESKVISHEAGHGFDLIALRDGLAQNVNGLPSFGTTHDSEIKILGEKSLTDAGVDLSTASDILIRNEGIANFFERYLTGSRTTLENEAPGFYKLFEQLMKKYPAMNDIFEQTSKDLIRYQGSDIEAKAGARFVTEAQSKKLFAQSFKERMTHKFFQLRHMFEDDQIAWHNSLDSMLKLDPSMTDRIKYSGNLLFNENGKVEEQEVYSWNRGMINFYGEPMGGESLKSIFKRTPDMQILDWYLGYANARDVEKPRYDANKKLREPRLSGIPKEEYEPFLEKYDSVYKPLAEAIGKWNDAHLKLMLDSGDISQELYDAATASRLTYAPLWRVIESIGKNKSGQGAGAAGFANLPMGVKRTVGGGGDALYRSPIESMMRNNILYRRISRHTTIMENFLSIADDMQGGGRIAEEEQGTVKITKLPDAEVVARLQKLKLDTDVLKQIAANKLYPNDPSKADPAMIDFGVTLFQLQNKANASDQTIIHRRDGKPVIYKIDDTDLYNAATVGDARMSGFGKSILGKVMRKQAQILRAGATVYDVRYAMRNIFRDPFSAFVMSNYGFNPIDWGVGFVDTVFGRDAKDEYHRHAAGWADQASQDLPSLKKMGEDLMYKDKGLMKKYGKRWSEAKTPQEYADIAWDLTGGAALTTVQRIGKVFEEATRVGVYTKTLDVLTGGKPHLATKEQYEIAVREAKDVTLPYHHHGTVGAQLNSVIPFSNANFQDISKFMREHSLEHIKSTKFRQNTIMKGLAYITPLSILSWYLGKDDDKINNLPSWRQAGFWNFNLKGVMGSDFIMSLPKPFLLGQVYGSSTEAALRWMYRKDPNQLSKWAEGAVKMIMPSIIPTGPLPLIENYFNYSTFRGDKIENQSLEQLLPEYRSTPNTSALANTLAHGTQWTGKMANSPVKIDNMIRAWTGSMGGTVTSGIGYLMAKTGVEDIPEVKPTLGETFPMSAFVTNPYMPSDYLRRFYDASKNADEIVKTFRMFEKTNDDVGQEKFFNEHEETLSRYLSDAATGKVGAATQIAKVKEKLSQISREMVLIRKSKDISGQEKQQQLLELSKLRDELAKEAFEELFLDVDKKEVF